MKHHLPQNASKKCNFSGTGVIFKQVERNLKAWMAVNALAMTARQNPMHKSITWVTYNTSVYTEILHSFNPSRPQLRNSSWCVHRTVHRSLSIVNKKFMKPRLSWNQVHQSVVEGTPSRVFARYWLTYGMRQYRHTHHACKMSKVRKKTDHRVKAAMRDLWNELVCLAYLWSR